MNAIDVGLQKYFSSDSSQSVLCITIVWGNFFHFNVLLLVLMWKLDFYMNFDYSFYEK